MSRTYHHRAPYDRQVRGRRIFTTYWHRADRVRARVELHTLTRLDPGLIVDEEPTPRRHRHEVMWFWW